MSETVPAYPPVGRTIAIGVVLAAVGFGGFGSWAALAPLQSAAIAPGTVTVDSNRKTIQHLDGGILAEILVRDGDRVVVGQPLVRLDDLETHANVGLLEGQLWSLLAQEQRLVAERDRLDRIEFPEVLTAHRVDLAATEIMAGQERIFANRRLSLESKTTIIRQRIAQLAAQSAAMDAQRMAGQRQLNLIQEEIAGVTEMVAKGLERRPRLLSLMRQEADLHGGQGDLTNRIAQVGEEITQADMEILGLQADRQSEIVVELREVQIRRAEAESKLNAAQVRQNRRDVVAPESGTVMNLRYFAPGAVVAPGGAILDIVPGEDRLVVEAKVNPTDIDVVHSGLPAKVILSSFKSRATPQLDGEVVRVSADALTDEKTGRPYYLARVTVDADQLRGLAGVQLQPGMPAETLIVTGERTMLRYLMQPIEDSFRTAFREE